MIASIDNVLSTITICIAIIILSVSTNIVLAYMVYQMSEYPFFTGLQMPIFSLLFGILALIIQHVLHRLSHNPNRQIQPDPEQGLLPSINNTETSKKCDLNTSDKAHSLLHHLLFTTITTKACWKYLLLICFLFSLENISEVYIMTLLGHNYSNIIVLLNQFTMPFSMLFSYLLYHQKHSVLNIIGSVIVIIGIGIAFSSHINVGNMVSVIYLFVYVLTCIPRSLGMVLTKHTFEVQLFNTFEFAVIENVAEIPFSFACSLLSMMILPGHPNVFLDYADGFKNMLSINNSVLGLVVLYAILGFFKTYSRNMLFHVSNKGVLLYLLISAISLPISDVCLSSQWIMGKYKADGENCSIYWAFVIVPIGILVHAFGERNTNERANDADETHEEDVVTP